MIRLWIRYFGICMLERKNMLEWRPTSIGRRKDSILISPSGKLIRKLLRIGGSIKKKPSSWCCPEIPILWLKTRSGLLIYTATTGTWYHMKGTSSKTFWTSKQNDILKFTALSVQNCSSTTKPTSNKWLSSSKKPKNWVKHDLNDKLGRV